MRNRPLCIVCMIFVCLAGIGTVYGREKFVRELRPSPAEQNFEEAALVEVAGEVYQKTEKETYQILYLKDVVIKENSTNNLQQSLRESKIILYDKEHKMIKIGEKLLADGELQFFENARNPGNFDQKVYYQSQNIHCAVWAESIKIQAGSRNLYEKLKNQLYEFRRKQWEGFCKVLGKKNGNTLAGIILGEKAEMDQDLKELYQVNGIGHILAISGLHLSVIGVGTYRGLRRMCGSYKIGGIAGICFLSLYIMMIGASVSAVRAFVMFLFRVGADMTGRNYDSITALFFAAVTVLIWRPLSIYNGGFWMSFGAVLAVILVLPAFRELLFEGLWASIAIHLVLFPVSLYYFYEFSVYSMFLNLIIIPLMSVLLLLGIIGGLFSNVLPGAADFILKCAGGILEVYEYLCDAALEIPGSKIVVGQPDFWQLIVYYILFIMAAAAWRERRKEKRRTRKVRKILSVVFLGVGILFVTFRFQDVGKTKVTMIDVGQGDCTFIRGSTGKTYLIDGGSSDVSSVGKYRIESFLKSQGAGTLDYVFVSHGDSDHINGIEEMLKRQKVGITIKTLVLPVKGVWDDRLASLAKEAHEYKVRVVTIEPGNTVRENKGVSITCLSPGKDFEGEPGNEASMVLSLTYGKFRMLFTGDTEDEGEVQLTKILYEKENMYPILKAAHHGSKNSSGKALLEQIKPKDTFISAGQNNRYGHPHKETLDRLKIEGSRVYCTKDAGAVTVIAYQDRYRVQTFRDSNGK